MYRDPYGLCDVITSDMSESAVSSIIDHPLSLHSLCDYTVSHHKVLEKLGMVWKGYCNHGFVWDVITHPCHVHNGG